MIDNDIIDIRPRLLFNAVIDGIINASNYIYIYIYI